MATVSSQDNSVLGDQSIPQWKRELILRRRTLVRTLPAGNSTVRLSRPSVIAAVRQPEQGTAAENVTIKQRSVTVASNKGILDQERTDLNSRERLSDHRELATAASVGGNMRLVEHSADASADVVLNGVGVINSSINVDSNSVKVCSKMGEETSSKIIPSAGRPVTDNSVLLSENNNCERSVDDSHSDSSEELEYGPGIVNKLRSKYLSMTLRESQNKGVRPSLVNLRRATSLENMLDSENLDAGKPQIKSQPRYVKKEDTNKPTVKPQKTSQHQQRYRPLSRGNDSLKRARSVEALYRNEFKGSVLLNRCPFRHPLKSHVIDAHKTSAQVLKPLVNDDIIIVENKSKINKAQVTENKTLVPQNKKMRTSNIAPEAELPPPDVVKTTMKIFEGSPGAKVKSVPLRPGNNINSKPNVKTSLPPKPNTDKVAPSKSPRKGLAPSPELRPFSPPNRLLSPDNLSTTSAPPPSPTSGSRKLKSPSPTIESKHAFFMGKDNLESEHQSLHSIISNGKSSSKKEEPEGNSADEDVGDGSTKTVPLTVLENIRKDGLSLQFSFNKTGNSDKTYLPSPKSPSHIDQLSPAEFVESPPLKIVSSSHISNSQQGSAKQVGVIRPMVTTNKPQFNSSVSGREMEKNIINKEKLNDHTKSKGPVKKKIDEVIEGVNLRVKTNSDKQSVPSVLRSAKPSDHLQNIMVFNFINRKDPPPDYIPDDGLNLAPKNKFKHGDKDVLILDPSLSGDSSTDDFAIGPPSPCNVTFEGANIVINGRSNLRKQPRASKLHISFNDSATTTFEYPSESSLLDTEEEKSPPDPKSSNSGSLTLIPPPGPTPGVPVPLGGSSLASYTPSKVHLGSEDFQLGVTRAAPAVDPVSKTPESSNTNGGELEQDEYLKPAEESETVAWSAETTADLLF